MTYDDAGRPTTQGLDGSTVANNAVYTPGGELAAVDYPLGLASGGNGPSCPPSVAARPGASRR